MLARHDAHEVTRAARQAFWNKFERDVDPEGVLPPEERARRAEMARKAHFARLALASAKARRKRSGPSELGLAVARATHEEGVAASATTPPGGRGTLVSSPTEADGSQTAPAPDSVELNPWQCLAYVQSPHLSGHYPGTVAAVAGVRCSGYYGPNHAIPTWPEWISEEGWLYYQTCFLFICSWNQIDHRYSGHNYDATAIAYTLAANCNNGNTQRWLVQSRGYAYGFNGTSWQAYTGTAQTELNLACSH
jgi:hypothetical protein